MKKGKKLYEGKAKVIFATDNKDFVIQHFKDDATAFNNQKRAKIEGKGVPVSYTHLTLPTNA